jgi:hypothetical protein
MTKRAALELDTLTIRIPMQLQRRGGRKLIIMPEGVGGTGTEAEPRRDAGQGARSRAPLAADDEGGRAKSITDLAEQEGVTNAYVCRLLPLTCLAPDIVEAILDGRQPKGLRLAEMLGNGPLAWNAQTETWRFSD